MDHGDAPRGHRFADEGEVQHQIQAVEHGEEEGHADDVEVQVHHGSAAGVLVGTHRGDQRGDAGADVLAHDDGDGAAVGDNARRTERLQDADAGTGTLDDAGDDGTHQNAQQGVGETDEEIGEPCLVLQRSHCAGHGGHAGHQNGKADQDSADAFPLFVLAHVEQDADEGEDRAEGGGLEHRDPEAVTLQAGKAQDPTGDGGAHVAAHDDADGLMQLHDATVDKADHHNGGGAGGLNHGGDAEAKEKALEGVIGQLAQNFLELAARLFFQCLAHDVHTEQEQSKTTQKRKEVEDCHMCFPHF